MRSSSARWLLIIMALTRPSSALLFAPNVVFAGRRCAPPSIRLLTYDDKLSLVKAGLAIPGMEVEGREATAGIKEKLKKTGVVEIGSDEIMKAREEKPKKRCTRDAPCELTAGDIVDSFILTPGPVILLAAFAYTVGVQAFEMEDATEDERLEQLAKRAEKSRQRRIERQKDLAARLEPLEAAFGWRLVSPEGLPTTDAYVFLAVAILAQLAFAISLGSNAASF